MKYIMLLVGVILLACGGYLTYQAYLEYTDPKAVYGKWEETQVMYDRKVVINFTKQGVYQNGHLLTTRFKFDGDSITFKTGKGTVIYEISGTADTPVLKRVQPASPNQILIRQGMQEPEIEGSKKKLVIRPNNFSSSE